MKKKLCIYAILILLSLLGISLLAYPIVSNNYMTRHQSQVLSQYEEAVEARTQTELDADRAIAERYNLELSTGILVDYTTSNGVAYKDILNAAENGVMGYVDIPRIDVMLPIYHGTGDDSLAKGAGHMPNTSLPIGGKSTHAVISAHSAMATARMFTDLELLEEGDQFFIHVLDEKLVYEVDRILTVLPSEIQYLSIVPGQDFVTLLTCVPYGVNSHRLLVRGHRVETEDVQIIPESEPNPLKAGASSSTWMSKYWEGIQYGLVIFAVLALLIAVAVSCKKLFKRKHS